MTRFDGSDYDPAMDNKRLTSQLETLKALMLGGGPRSLRQISTITGYSEASISAQLRNLRKRRFGAYTVSKMRSGNPEQGLFVYTVSVPELHYEQMVFA
jgi:hypothetical protein